MVSPIPASSSILNNNLLIFAPFFLLSMEIVDQEESREEKEK